MYKPPTLNFFRRQKGAVNTPLITCFFFNGLNLLIIFSVILKTNPAPSLPQTLEEKNMKKEENCFWAINSILNMPDIYKDVDIHLW